MPSECVSANCRMTLSVSTDGDDHDDGTTATTRPGPESDPGWRPHDGRGKPRARALRAAAVAAARGVGRGRTGGAPPPGTGGGPRGGPPGPTKGPGPPGRGGLLAPH